MPLEKKSKQQTYYNIDWEDPNLHPDHAKWICKGKDNTLFNCKVCKNWNLVLGKSGIAAPTHHMKPSKEPGKKTKHERMMTAVSKTSSLAACLTSSTMTKEPSTSSITEENLQPSLQVSTSKKNFFPSQHVAKAEVLLAMKSVTSHISSRGMDEFPDLLRLMLPDSEIAKDIHIHRTKFRYVISHGLAPYFKERFMGIIKDALRFTVCFDESLNKTCSCRKQLDVHVICLDENDFLVKRFYIGSAFIGHGDADSCLESLLGVLGELDYVHKLVQIGMDGPNVNWKLHSMLKEKRLLKDPQSPNLLEIGSCSTHVLHGAYNTAQSATDWGLAKFLKSCHSIFKDSPARRSDYLAANNLDTAHEGKDTSYLFPLKFCGHRWLENVKCLNRVVEIIPYLTVYFNFLVREKKMPKNDERFEGIKTFLSKPHAPAILQFSLCIMRDFEPYLELFQAERPLAFFLFQKLKVLLNSLLCKFVRPEVIKNSVIRKLMQLDFKDSSKLLPDSSVDVGFGAKGSLKKLKTTESTYARQFQGNAKQFFVSLLTKLFERCPIKYNLTLYVSSLSPTEISSKSNELLVKRFDNLLELLVECRWISPASADRAKAQYCTFINNQVIDKVSEFELSERVDEFYMQLFKDLNLNMPNMQDVVKICLIISHGQGRVESGFSVNDQILIENMKQESVVAQRIVHEGIMKEGGVLKVDINSKMLNFVRRSRGVYELTLEENKKTQTEGEKRREERKRISREINDAVLAKKVATESIKDTINNYDSKIHDLKKKLVNN